MMRILLLGPRHDGGSLPPYLDVLADGLRHLGAHVDHHGSPGVPYDQDRQEFWSTRRIVTAAANILNTIDLTRYDLLSVHFGNLEIEQLLPILWTGRAHPPAVYHVHTLNPTLFDRHVPNAHLHDAVQHAIRRFDGYVYFGQYARTVHGALPGQAATVAWLPTTIPAVTRPDAHATLAAALDVPPGLPLISLYGYSAPWKDARLLYAAATSMATPARILLAGDFWDDQDHAGIDLRATTAPRSAGITQFVVVPGYLAGPDRAALIRASNAGVFPYQRHPSFQGSGAIADYLAHGIPVVATDIANMSELVAETGCIVSPGNPTALAAALDRIIRQPRTAPGPANRIHAGRFTPTAHATRCLTLYEHVIARHAGRKP